MAVSYIIRDSRLEDADAVSKMWSLMAAQHRQYDSEVWCWSDEAVQRWRESYIEMMSKSEMLLLVAQEDPGRSLMGFCVSTVKASSPIFSISHIGEIWDLFVDPAYRGQGIGKALMDETFERLKQRGAADAILHVSVKNESAIKLYEKLGMRRVMYRMFKKLK